MLTAPIEKQRKKGVTNFRLTDEQRYVNSGSLLSLTPSKSLSFPLDFLSVSRDD